MLPFSEYELAQKFTEEIAGGRLAFFGLNPRLSARGIAVGRIVKLIVDQSLDAAREQHTGVG
jgi:hypothetical protein